MSKKVRYAIGAIGALPALGLLTPQATAATATAHTARKTVRTDLVHQPGAADDAHCVANASSKHSHTQSKVRLTFWTAPRTGGMCIGTIEVHALKPVSGVSEIVENANGAFCSDRTLGSQVNFRCNDVFNTKDLSVWAIWWSKGAPHNFKLPASCMNCAYTAPSKRAGTRGSLNPSARLRG
jgi:hypothetical protein